MSLAKEAAMVPVNRAKGVHFRAKGTLVPKTQKRFMSFTQDSGTIIKEAVSPKVARRIASHQNKAYTQVIRLGDRLWKETLTPKRHVLRHAGLAKKAAHANKLKKLPMPDDLTDEKVLKYFGDLLSKKKVHNLQPKASNHVRTIEGYRTLNTPGGNPGAGHPTSNSMK